VGLGILRDEAGYGAAFLAAGALAAVASALLLARRASLAAPVPAATG
jgi:hypothetical protein